MGCLWTFLLGILFIGIALVANWYAQAQAKKRTDAWAQWASGIGYTFSAQDPFAIAESYPFPLFTHGHSRTVSNVMHGEYRGRGFICFDFRYVVNSGRSTTTYKFTCLLLKSTVELPALVVRPESLADKLGHLVGMHDISLPSEEFNRRFFVKCADPEFAIKALSQPVMDFLLQQAHPPNRPLAIEALEHAVLLHNAGNLPYLPIPGGVKSLMDLGIDLMDRLEGGMGTGQAGS